MKTGSLTSAILVLAGAAILVLAAALAAPGRTPGAQAVELNAAAGGGEAGAISDAAIFRARPSLRRIEVYNAFTLGLEGIIELEARPDFMLPTPGGVSVFVSYEQGSGLEGVIDVFSAETLAFQKRSDTGLSGIEYFSFSPDGSRFYLFEDSETLHVYTHRLLELSDGRSFKLPPGRGPLVPDRRGLRLYRADAEPGGAVQVFYAQTMEALDPAAMGAEALSFTADGRYLWGRDSAGGLHIINERDGSRLADGSLLLLPAQDNGSAGRGTSGTGTSGTGEGDTRAVSGKAAFLGWAAPFGETIAVIGPGSESILFLSPDGGIQGRTALAGAYHSILPGPGQSLVLLSDRGIIRFDERLNSRELILPEADEHAFAVTAIPQRNGSFACF